MRGTITYKKKKKDKQTRRKRRLERKKAGARRRFRKGGSMTDAAPYPAGTQIEARIDGRWARAEMIGPSPVWDRLYRVLVWRQCTTKRTKGKRHKPRCGPATAVVSASDIRLYTAPVRATRKWHEIEDLADTPALLSEAQRMVTDQMRPLDFWRHNKVASRKKTLLKRVRASSPIPTHYLPDTKTHEQIMGDQRLAEYGEDQLTAPPRLALRAIRQMEARNKNN